MTGMLDVGDLIANTFELRELVSRTAEVQQFTGFDLALGRAVTIRTTIGDEGIELLRREARMLASFAHPGIIDAYSYGTHGDSEYLVLEPLHGTTLATYMQLRRGRGSFSASETIEILLGIADALAVIHAAGAVHGNLSAEAVVLANGARLVLRDLATPSVAPGHGPERRHDLRALGEMGMQLADGKLDTPVGPLISDLLGGMMSDASIVAAALRSIRGTARADRDRPPTIIVADDDPAMRDLTCLVLSRAAPGAVVHQAANGLEAIELVERTSPDLLLLDIDMPGFTGLEVCSYLRGATPHDRLAIGVVSSYASVNRAALARLGVLDVFQKGELPPEQLVVALGTLLRRIRVMPEPHVPEQPGNATLIGGRYEIGRELGTGGMGAVYEARHARLGKRFALKVINASNALDAATRARFNEEAQLASEIDHPNIVSVIDYGEDPKVGAYMVMDLVHGQSLADLANQGLSVERACELLGQVADALTEIHAHGIVHGDVKAENILVVDDRSAGQARSVARLLDFGLARRLSRMASADLAVIVGTPHYMAPECATGEPGSVRSDVYALGVLGYLLLAGTLPFDGDAHSLLVAQVRQTPEAIHQRRGSPVDPALELLILKAMAKRAADRYATAAEFRAELDRIVQREPSENMQTDAQIARVFTRSTVAQAVLTPDWTIAYANDMFVELGAGDPAGVLAAAAGLSQTVIEAWRAGAPQVWRGRLPSTPDRELVVLASPLWTARHEIHLIARLS